MKRTAAEDCSGQGGQVVKEGEEVVFTYGVEWRESANKWATRWDTYLATTMPAKIHWFSLLNSVILVILLTGITGSFLLRNIHRDVLRYEEEEDLEVGWKVIHGDVFRGPRSPRLLSLCIGSGAQVLFVTAVTMAFAVLGFLSPSNRGALIQSSLFVFAFSGCISGYVSVE